jgi:sec-independent protein translocase protein TatC
MPSRPTEEEMLPMSFIEHLTELRARLIKALLGLAAAYILSLTFTDPLWRFICRPAAQALQSLGYPPQLYVFH